VSFGLFTETPLLVTQVSPSPTLRLALDRGVPKYNYTRSFQTFCPPPNIYCDSVGSDGNILKELNYGNEIEKIIHEYEA
jgi:hypothetical protein